MLGQLLFKSTLYKTLIVSLLSVFSTSLLALNIEVTVDNDRPLPNSYLQYRIVVGNTDGVTRSDVVVSATIPSGTQLIEARSLPVLTSCPGSTCEFGETLNWSLGSIAPGEFKVIHFPLLVFSSTVDGADLTLSTSVTHSGGTPVTDSVSATADTSPAIELSISAQEQLVGADEDIDYVISFGNIGSTGLVAPELRAAIPAGTTFIDASDGGTLDGTDVVWDIDVLEAGQGGKRFMSVATADSAANGEILPSVVELNSSGGATLASGGESVVIRSGVDLTLDVTVTGDTFLDDSITNYRYVVANKGSVAITDVNLYVQTSDRTQFTASGTLPTSSCVGSSCEASEWGTFALGTLAAGESRVINIPVYDFGTPRDGEPLVNFAVLTEGSGAYTLGTKPTAIFDSEPTLDLSVGANRQVVAAGETYEYEVAYGNVDTTAYQNLVLELDLPAGASFVEASDGGTESSGTVSWDLSTLASGEGNKRKVTIQAPAGLANGEVLTSAVILHTGGESLARASESVVIRSGVDLTLDVTVTGDTFLDDSITNYRYVVANKGSVAITDVNLYVQTSDRTQFTASGTLPTSSCVGSSCEASEWGTFALGTLAAGESRVINIPVYDFGTPRDGEPLVNFAVLTEGSGAYTLGTKPTAIFDSEPTLDLSVGANRQVVAAGETYEYEVAYGNVDTTAYQNLVLELDLPVGASFVEASDGGTESSGTVSWDLSTLASGEGNKRKVTIQAPAGLANGEVLTSAVILHTGGESLARASESVVIRSGVDLTLDVTVTGDTFLDDSITNYRYVVANKGSVAITDVNLYVQTSDRTQFTASGTLPTSSCVGSSCEASEWGNFALGTLAAGESRVINIPVYDFGTPRDGEPLVNFAVLTEGSGAYTLGTKPTAIFDSEPTLDLSVGANRQVVAAGETYEYEVAYGNVDTTAYQNLVLELDLPVGASFVEASDGGTESSGTVSWDLSTLASGEGNKRKVTIQAPAGLANGEVLTSAVILHTGGESLARASESVVIRSDVDLTLDVSIQDDVLDNENITLYRYLIANKGSVAITDVNLYVQTSDRTQFTASGTLPTSSCVGSSCEASEWGNFALGTLAAGESRVINIPVYDFGTPRDGEPLVNYAVLTQGSGAYTLGIKPTSIEGDPQGVQIAIEAERHKVSLDDSVEFAIKVGNRSSVAIQDSLLVVDIPEGYTFVSASGTSELEFDSIKWPLGNLPANSWVEELVTLQVAGNLLEAEVLTLTARIEEGLSENNTLARASINSVIENGSSIVISTSDTASSPLSGGSSIPFSITTTNSASVALADVNLYNMVPDRTSVSESGIGSTNCAGSTCEAGEWALWELGSLASGASDTQMITPVIFSSAPADGSLLLNFIQLSHSTNPRHDTILTRTWGVGPEYNAPSDHDSDEDGIPDWWEIRWGYDRLDSSDASTDDDNDGSDNLEEYTEDSLPNNPDSDGDTFLDGPDPFPREDRAPIANAGVDQILTEGDLVALDATSSEDPDSGSLIYNWVQTGGTTISIANPTSATASFTAPQIASTETIELTVTVEDAGGQTASDIVVITVNDDGIVIIPNQPPTADAGPDQTINEGLSVALDASASTDSDGSVATYQWTQTAGTSVTLSDATIANPSFTAPDVTADETLTFSLLVTDNEGAVSTSADTVNVTVSFVAPVNVAPTANAGMDQTVDEETMVSLDGSASTDSDGTITTYQWTQTAGTAVALSDATIANPSFFAPNITANETLTFSLVVTDNEGASSTADTVDILINFVDPMNILPTANAGVDQMVDEGTTVTLSGTGQDTDGTISNYLWTQVSGTTAIINNADSAEASFVAPDVASDETLIFALTVTDNSGATASDQVEIFVRDVAALPVVSLVNIAVNPTTFAEGSGEGVVLSFNVQSNSGDVQIDALTVQAAGELDELVDITSVSLYQDLNADGIADASELVGSDVFTSDNGEVSFQFTARMLNAGNNPFLVTYEF